MDSYIIALLLVAAPLAFAAFLLFFMMSGKGTKPLENSKDSKEAIDEIEGKKNGQTETSE